MTTEPHSDRNQAADFEHLLPDTMLTAVEDALGRRMTGLATPLPSYINRVYEVQTMDGERLVAKFYRPGRWSREALQDEFRDVTRRILDRITDLFDDVDFIRIHGDCHCGNLLYRPGEGIMIIDFDDMMVGPPVQDLWLLLPDRADRCQRELALLLRGYELFREFDDLSLRLIEPLRAMRIVYFLAWCSRQVNDFKFRAMYPDWGSDAFWQREVNDLSRQLHIIGEHVGP